MSSSAYPKKGIIYLLGDTLKEGVFKIGVTRGSLDQRIKKLQTGNSGEIYVVDKFESDYPFFVEQSLHRKYNHKKEKNEWFNLTIEEMSSFKDNCRIYEEIAISLKDNPFFRYNNTSSDLID